MLVWVENDKITYQQLESKIQEISDKVAKRGFRFDGIKIIGSHVYLQFQYKDAIELGYYNYANN